MNIRIAIDSKGPYTLSDGRKASLSPIGFEVSVPAVDLDSVTSDQVALAVAAFQKRTWAASQLASALNGGAQCTRLDGTTKVTLAIDYSAQDSWVRCVSSITLAKSVGAADDTAYKDAVGRDILDASGVPVTNATIGEVQQLLAQAMAAIGAAENSYQTRLAAINAATSVDQVNAVQ